MVQVGIDYSQLAEDICIEIRKEKEWVNWEVISTWTFRDFLDKITTIISEKLSHSFTESDVGCSLFYKRENKFILGGSSTSRMEMEPSSRYYDVDDDTHKKSFTVYSALVDVSFILDDFTKAVVKFQPQIEHIAKDCELRNSDTKSYLTFPSSSTSPIKRVDDRTSKTEIPENIDAHLSRNDSILRLSSRKKNIASEIERVFLANERKLLRLIFTEIMQLGIRKLLLPRNDALAIADLQTDLLMYRNREFDGLNKLTYHIQALFDPCECSIFLSHKSKDEEGTFHLYLASTTAWSSFSQHRAFRKHFFDELNSYKCSFDGNNQPIPDERLWAKTEHAFYRPQYIYKKSSEQTESHFPGKCEVDRSEDFLALAIHRYGPQQFPYGVIRIIKHKGSSFSITDDSLALGIAKGLSYWLDFFPKNERLAIKWLKEGEHKEWVLKNLAKVQEVPFDDTEIKKKQKSLEIIELEFEWLLQKIFQKAKKITIKEIFGGKSGAIVLLVENDFGQDLILKCARKAEPSNKGVPNDITLEVDNYREFIEGRLELNHNIIYPELIRETRHLIGFATSFLTKRDSTRISLNRFCEEAKGQPALLKSLSRLIEKFIGEVWWWWYKPREEEEEREQEDSLWNFIYGIQKKDKLFEFLLDFQDSLNSRITSKLREYIEFEAKKFLSPKELWNNFERHVKGAKEYKVKWTETVTHGDVHGGNIFFDTNSLDVWVIDFARTAKRVSVFDLAMLESELKFQQLPKILPDNLESDFFQNYREIEKQLASQEDYEHLVLPKLSTYVNKPYYEALTSILKVVIDIRQIASQMLRRSGCFTDYKCLLFLFSFKYMKLSEATSISCLLAYFSSCELKQNLTKEIVKSCD